MISAHILRFPGNRDDGGRQEDRSLCIQDIERNIVLLDYLVKLKDNSPIESFGNLWGFGDVSKFYKLIAKD